MMTKIVFGLGTFMLLLIAQFSAPTAVSAVPDCSWEQNGCTTTVNQGDDGWDMTIACDDGDGGYWEGTGTWGGECP